jgi:transcriptional regulator with XRE-family HTH domain
MIRLKEWRERRFLTQQQLADESGVAPATIVRIEQGQVVPNFGTLRKLAAALAVTLDDLVPDAAAFAAARHRTRGAAAKSEAAA